METEESLQQSLQLLAKDPKRKAKSNDPGWKYAVWPDLNRKDVVKCILCGNENHGGINRFKQHLIGGFPDIIKCSKTTREIAKEMNDYVQSRKKIKSVQIVEECGGDDEVQEIMSTAASNTMTSSQFAAQKKSKAVPSDFRKPALSKSVSSMLMKTPSN